jgi:hypothetical protein
VRQIHLVGVLRRLVLVLRLVRHLVWGHLGHAFLGHRLVLVRLVLVLRLVRHLVWVDACPVE